MESTQSAPREFLSDQGIDRYLRLMVAILFVWLNQHISRATGIA